MPMFVNFSFPFFSSKTLFAFYREEERKKVFAKKTFFHAHVREF
jgi:hypothetical protein